jgi:hypothetical protein
MFDLSTLSPEVLNARGAYSTVRAAHEDEIKELQVMCGGLASLASQILRAAQKDADAPSAPVEALIANALGLLQEIDECTKKVDSLAKQKAELKPLAWGKR